MKSKFKIWLVGALLFIVNLVPIIAQCPMCKASAEANLREGGTAALGLNTGIIYLFLTPYLIIVVIGGLWWYNRNKNKSEITQ